MTLDSHGFEAAIVRHCSPTLAGIKPGCLFNVPGVFAADLNEEPAIQLEQWRTAHELCEKLNRLIAKTSAKLETTGVCITVLAYRHCGALVYVWRPALLAQTLAIPEISKQLSAWGYTKHACETLVPAIELLGQRLERCQRVDPNASFPHEVGFFLGYPYADVMGFIEHDGQDYLCCGCWKVYAEQEQAEACFMRYKRCTAAYEQLLSIGASITDLAQIHIAA